MDLGTRLKQARLDAGLSQRQLCGDTITRNMLSQIENGSANPSMETLRYLAERLQRPVSFFLEGTAASPNQSHMDAARRHFSAGEFSAVLDALEEYRTPDPVFDPEFFLLKALAYLSLAEAETEPHHARQLLDAAAEAGASTPYCARELERRRLLRLSQLFPGECPRLEQLLPPDDRELLLRARAALAEENIPRCLTLLEAAANRNTPEWLLLRGDAAMGTPQLELAEQYYLQAEKIAPRQAYPKLEQLYLRREDFKMAYHYACKQR